MGVYTKTGDKGTTGLLTGERVNKDCLRVEAYGNVDEISSALGLARSFCKNVFVKDEIYKLQKLNMSIMAELASRKSVNYITVEHCNSLEAAIDKVEAELPPLRNFLISGTTQGGAALDFARTITRRAERRVWQLSREEVINENVLIVLNRISDFCFVLMRLEEI